MASKITFARDFAWPISVTTLGTMSIGWGAMNDAYDL
jgi:hypothetical protein